MEEIKSSIGNIIGDTTNEKFSFTVNPFTCRTGDLVKVVTEIPSETNETNLSGDQDEVTYWARIYAMERFNPFLPNAAVTELAKEGIDVYESFVASESDKLTAHANILGQGNDLIRAKYPVKPSARVLQPTEEEVKRILIGKQQGKQITIGNLLGRKNIKVKLDANKIVARHMAILAMTGGGKTVAAKTLIHEFIKIGYPLVIFDPHGDYLGLSQAQKNFSDLFGKAQIKLFYANVEITNENKWDIIGYAREGANITEAQEGCLDIVIENRKVPDPIDVENFVNKVIDDLKNNPPEKTGKSTVNACIRHLKSLNKRLTSMKNSNSRLRENEQLKDFNFQPLPNAETNPTDIVMPNQVSVIYLAGYDSLTQSSIASKVLTDLYEKRAKMTNDISPFMVILEEAHNLVPSRSEGIKNSPSVAIIRRVITEGRKFGVGLLLITQRPSRLDETTLAQCNSYIILRLVNPRDQDHVKRTMETVSDNELKALPDLNVGEALVCGQAIKFPNLVKISYEPKLDTDIIGNESFVEQAETWVNENPEKINSSKKLDEAIKEYDEEG